MPTKWKSQEEILSREYITRNDIRMLLHVGDKIAQDIFDKVREQAEQDGKINVPGRILWRRMYRMLGMQIPKEKAG